MASHHPGPFGTNYPHATMICMTHTCKFNSLYNHNTYNHNMYNHNMYNHNSQFSSYIYHKSYGSISVQYSRHIFITNHMNTIQYKQVASVLTSCCPLDIHINRNSYIYHKSYECTFISSHSSVQSCCPLDIHINSKSYIYHESYECTSQI